MIPAEFEYHAPTSVQEAVDLLKQYDGEAKILAGGHSLLPLLKLRFLQPTALIDIARIPNLDYIRAADGKLTVGALATYNDLERSEAVQRIGVLHDVVPQVGDAQIRNR